MDCISTNRSPKEEGELEDGEICDDETEENVFVEFDGGRPSNNSRIHKMHQHIPNLLSLMGHKKQVFPPLMSYNLGPHVHGALSNSLRPPSGPDRTAPPGLGNHGEPSPRSSFWERSHGALGRFRHRPMPNGGHPNWNRGCWGDGSGFGRETGNLRPLGRFGSADSHINKKESPTRKQKPPGRNQVRKPVNKSEKCSGETFEDLLSKYKQIQLELECIRKEETMALEPKISPLREEAQYCPASVPQAKPEPSIQSQALAEETAEKKMFLAFNIKPLRQKLLTPAGLDLLKKKHEEEEEEDGEASLTSKADVKEGEQGPVNIKGEATNLPDKEAEPVAVETVCVCGSKEEDGSGGQSKLCACCRGSSTSSEDSSASTDKVEPKGKVEEEELSEMQLRLLALQSASKKWHQKEQQVLKESKERITKASQEKSSGSVPSGSGSASSAPAQPSIAAAAAKPRVTTRSASSAASAAATSERSRTRSRTLERDRAAKAGGGRPATRDWERANAPPERDRAARPGSRPTASRPTASRPPASRPPVDRGRPPPAKPHSNRKTVGPGEKGSAAKQAVRKQQLRTWKMQQQEEEERRKREDEIRKIRDLSNQDEQYNRFMKLVGIKASTRSKSSDREHRKSTGKRGLDTSGNLYQYDNYDEVAMDTDSETGSPVPSPHNPCDSQEPVFFPQVYLYPPDNSHFLMNFPPPLLPAVPPPPPPPPPPPVTTPPEEVQPPKPPFADEEEEEEMLLRETCLMSMANKRVAAFEEPTGASGPPSPSSQCAGGNAATPQPVAQSNLSTVSLNTVSQPRANKFATRGLHVTRVPLVASEEIDNDPVFIDDDPVVIHMNQLPRHKAVVVRLNDTDDSDSDVDACSSTQAVFGGLEFMIKEARRTAEATKPKGPSASEKENNPMKTPEALSDAKKTEYRLLKEEIASREKHRTLKELGHSPRSEASPTASDSEADFTAKAAAELQLSQAEDQMEKHRAMLQKDEAILRQLLQQELKKRESLKAAETKVAKLKEQLLASEKVVTANKILMKKLQEQVHRVEHRLAIKKSLTVKLDNELAQAQRAAGRGLKRWADPNQAPPGKLARVDGAPRGSERHFAELIAQKQRLQRLESEYALKIQKLKAAQALHNRGPAPAEPPAAPPTPLPPAAAPASSLPGHRRPPRDQTAAPVPPPSSPFPLPQPSLHDLTQDKLVLGGEDAAEPADGETPSAAAASRGARRRSLRRSGSVSFTKPKLEQTPVQKDASRQPDSSAAPRAKAGSSGPSQAFTGLDVEALRQRHRRQPGLQDILLGELQRVGQDMQMPTGKVSVAEEDTIACQGRNAEPSVPFGPYRSPLLVFKSYRFSPYYRTKEKLPLSSVSYSNTVEPKKCFCRFDLTGTCNDDDCRWQHMRNCTLSGNQLFQDVLSYNLSLIGCSENSSDDEVRASTEKYIKKLFGTNKDRMGIDQKAVLLVSKVNESKQHVPPFTTCKDMRVWRPKPAGQRSPCLSEDSEEEGTGGHLSPVDDSSTSLSALDVCVTPDDKRYFVSETDDIANLESSVLESPRDAQLWIKLAFKYLSQNETSASECLDSALNTLSRALEDNSDNPEIWCHYLSLFSRRGSREEVQEMCEMAVEHAPDYKVWRKYLSLEASFEGKDYVCDRLLRHLLSASPGNNNNNNINGCGGAEKLSFQLLEALLYRVELNLFTGRMGSALAILQNALKSSSEASMAARLTPSDRALLWLSYIHLTEFDRLPCRLYDPACSGPARLVSREGFRLPWTTARDISTPPDILVALFKDAVGQCTDQSLPPADRTHACMPLYTNLVFLHGLLGRFDEGVQLCSSLLALCPGSCVLRDALAELHTQAGFSDRAVSMWLNALAECPNNAEVFYYTCRFLMDQGQPSAIVPLFRAFVLSLCEDEQNQKQPVDVLRRLLGIPTAEILRGPVIKKDLQELLSRQTPYLHLVHSRWQWLQGSEAEAVDAFERALGSPMQLDVLHRLWMDYLLFSSSRLAGGQAAGPRSKQFPELVKRCLGTVPSRLGVPFSPAQFWSCYRFHNEVVTLYLSCLPQSQHALALERLRYAMPNNIELGLRLLHQELQDGNIEQLKFQARLLTSSVPKCLAVWKIAVAVEIKLKERAEVRRLYQQAIKNLPLCAALWKDRMLFEAAEGGKPDALRRHLDKCREVGVNLSEPLNIGPGLAQEVDT